MGSDGASYSVELLLDEESDGDAAFAAALLFVRWSEDGVQPIGHLETEYLAVGATRAKVKDELQRLTLSEVKAHLERLIEKRREIPDW